MHVSIYNIHDKERARARRLPVVKPTFLVGSDPTCDIRIEDDPKVSPRHATIAVRASSHDLVAAVSITPLAGSTRVNGTKIAEETTTKIGDTLQLGDTILKFRPDVAAQRSREIVPPAFEVPATPLPPSEASPWARPVAPHSAPEPVGPGSPISPWARPVVTTEPPTPPIPTQPRPTLIGNPAPPQNLAPPVNNPPAPRPLSPPVPPMPYRPNAHRQVLSNDPMEQQFLATLRDTPRDQATRLVYADWLEQRGHTARAEFVRTEAHLDSPRFVDESDLDWRAITSRAPIEHCGYGRQCPGQWDRLDATSDDDRARTCKACLKRVYFCHDHNRLHNLGMLDNPVVFDASLDPISAHQFYGGAPGEPVATLEDGIRVPESGEPVDTLRDDES